jgi:CRP/FNR family transcriptional regulator, cyclic AMP receptor protein
MARKDSKLDHLAQVRLFRACSRKELTTIGRASDEVRVSAGKTIVEEGQTGHEFFLILEGNASVTRNGRKVATLGPGDYFGELALLDRGPRNATVKADGDMEILVLGQREFSGVLDEVPTIAHKLLSSMATRLREADAKQVAN